MCLIVRKNFTLIELLVVIAIIAILAGILLPVLNSARGKGRSISCLSNLKQFSICEGMYQNTFSEYLAPAIDNNRVVAPHLYTGQYHWDYYFGKFFLKLKTSASDWPTGNGWKIFQCPSDMRPITAAGSQPRSYAILYSWVDISDTQNAHRINRIKAPSLCIFAAENDPLNKRPEGGNRSNAYCGYSSAEGETVFWSNKYMGWNHGLKTNMLMLDGHVSSIFVHRTLSYNGTSSETSLYYTKLQ